MMGGFVHGEDGSPAADIEDDLVFEKVLIVDDCLHVGFRANLIFLLESVRSVQRKEA